MKSTKLNLMALVFTLGVGNLLAQNSEKSSIVNKTQDKGNLVSLHNDVDPLSVKVLFTGEEGVTRSLQIKKGGILKEHIIQTVAILICVKGEVTYEDEFNTKHVLKAGGLPKN